MKFFKKYLSLIILIALSGWISKGNNIPEMIFINGGNYKMGCTEEQIPFCISDEKPVVDVILNDFWIGKFEVTNAQYAEFLNHKGNPSEGGDAWYRLDKYSLIEEIKDGSFELRAGYENYPVNNVSWYGATAYTEWLSDITGENYRLPTEAEWEYAARGGQKNSVYIYSGSNTPEEVAWFSDFASNSDTQWGFKMDKGTHPVGLKAPNELGLYDMSGNLAEWCSDFYENYYEGGENPKGAEYGSLRVLRGGSWDNNALDCRVSNRSYAQPVNRFAVNKGFRVVKDLN